MKMPTQYSTHGWWHQRWEDIKAKAIEAGETFKTTDAASQGRGEAEDDEKKVSGVDLDADGNVEINSEETKIMFMRR